MSEREEQFLDIWNLHAKDCDLPVREYKFHPTRKWRLDFAWPDYRVAVEIEGGTFSRGRTGHTSGPAIQRDCDKHNELHRLGWRCLRFTSVHLDEDPIGCVEKVLNLVELAGLAPCDMEDL